MPSANSGKLRPSILRESATFFKPFPLFLVLFPIATNCSIKLKKAFIDFGLTFPNDKRAGPKFDRAPILSFTSPPTPPAAGPGDPLPLVFASIFPRVLRIPYNSSLACSIYN